MTTIHEPIAEDFDPEQDDEIACLADRFVLAASGSRGTFEGLVTIFFDKEAPDQPQDWRDETLTNIMAIIRDRAQAAQEAAMREEQAAEASSGPQWAKVAARLKRIANGYRDGLTRLEQGLVSAAVQAEASPAV